MPWEEHVIEDSEEDYEHFSDSDSSQGLNHSEYLRLAREQMKDELRQRRSKRQSEHTTDECSIPNSNEQLRKEINDAQEDLQRAFSHLRKATVTRPALDDISNKHSIWGEVSISLTYPESLELPPAYYDVPASNAPNSTSERNNLPDSARHVQCNKLFNIVSGLESSADSDEGDLEKEFDSGFIDGGYITDKLSEAGFLTSPGTNGKEYIIHDYKYNAVNQGNVSPASPPESQQSPNRSFARNKQSAVADDVILFPPFPVSSSLAETVIISSSMPTDVHDDHDADPAEIEKPLPKPSFVVEKKRKQHVEEKTDHEIKMVAKKLKVQTGDTTICADLEQIHARITSPSSLTKDEATDNFEVNKADVIVRHDVEQGIGHSRARAERTKQMITMKNKPGPVLFKQPAFRVGLSKRDRVDSLHAYLRR
ncbi:uncharacterized protein V1513DRAFT_454215 [Lipomyces chichibuensis]|uniref:uncharacterized protein n=1 Tax=Lipomyces chichibuensis TaxID=1546026 RepID=UPI0033437307